MKIKDKIILDACCGSRMFWFDKEHPNVVFGDIRTESHILCDGRPLEISPDVEMSFTKMPFEDESFRLVVLDPPHMERLGKGTWMAQKYGVLLPSWREDLKEGFNECMRVLMPYGTLIFKWNEAQVKLNQVLELFPTVRPRNRETR